MAVIHELHSIKSAEVIGAHALRLVFEDDVTREVDLSSVLAGEIYGPLRDPEFFKQVRLDPEVHTVVWPNDADFDPETLYYWDKYLPSWKEAAKKWEQHSVNNGN
jgi:hypothetical protein